MDETRFDRLTQMLSHHVSRRTVLATLTAIAGLTVMQNTEPVLGKAKRKKKIAFNAFGCVIVGGGCRGNSANCCSGICQGKKPKQGEKDNSRCIAHNEGGCAAGIDSCVAPVECGANGRCFTTTGGGGFCGVSQSGDCRVCATDNDCVALGFGAGAACLPCAICPQTGGTACAPAAA